MLKIKDNIDLKELEKYGFKPLYNINTGELEKMIFTYYPDAIDIVRVFARNREIYCGLLAVDEKYEKLYDLIKADLVEKVDSNE